jgi:hypothetical protein
MSLGGILLCVTGMGRIQAIVPHLTPPLCCMMMISRPHLKPLFEFAGSEAMYADLGHFSQSSIKVRDECLSLKFHFIVLCH